MVRKKEMMPLQKGEKLLGSLRQAGQASQVGRPGDLIIKT